MVEYYFDYIISFYRVGKVFLCQYLQANYKLALKDSALDHFASDIYKVGHHV